MTDIPRLDPADPEEIAVDTSEKDDRLAGMAAVRRAQHNIKEAAKRAAPKKEDAGFISAVTAVAGGVGVLLETIPVEFLSALGWKGAAAVGLVTVLGRLARRVTKRTHTINTDRPMSNIQQSKEFFTFLKTVATVSLEQMQDGFQPSDVAAALGNSELIEDSLTAFAGSEEIPDEVMGAGVDGQHDLVDEGNELVRHVRKEIERLYG